MASEIRPGVWGDLFAAISTEAERRTAVFLEKTAAAMAANARDRLASAGSHAYGTPTPASAGGPPAVISGTLRESVTAGPVTNDGRGLLTARVGTAGGRLPPYGTRTPADEYGSYLERGLRNGTSYPWLVPAFRYVTTGVMQTLIAGYTGDASRWPSLP